MPSDGYLPIIRSAKEHGILTLLDTSDQFLLRNLAALPDIVKPNAAEAATLLGHGVHSVGEAATAVRELQERGIAIPIITLGEMGAVAATDVGVFAIPAVPVRVVSAAGAGDGFNAGLLQARQRGMSWPEALRWAAAVATAVLLRPGTGDCQLEDVQTLYAQVRLERA
jgi:fructose-1-phosphate kinase PfkB-like protein